MVPKINLKKISNSGLIARHKSNIHFHTIDCRTGRRKQVCPISVDEEFINGRARERWPNFGRFKLFISDKKLIKSDISRLKDMSKENNRKLDLIFLGPGKGAEIRYFYELLNKQNVPVNFDSYSLSDSLTKKTKEIIRNNGFPEYISEKAFFENLNHIKYVNKYDYIYSYLGVGVHSSNIEVTLLKVASMLRKGGFARIDISFPTGYNKILENINAYLYLKNAVNKVKFRIENEYLIIEKLDY